MHPKIVILSLAQACYWFAVLVGISLSTVIGLQLAPSESLATLHYALISVGALAATYLLSMLMQRYGRRLGFQIGAFSGVLAAGLAMLALSTQSFVSVSYTHLDVYKRQTNSSINTEQSHFAQTLGGKNTTACRFTGKV